MQYLNKPPQFENVLATVGALFKALDVDENKELSLAEFIKLDKNMGENVH